MSRRSTTILPPEPSFAAIRNKLKGTPRFESVGRVSRVVGLLVEAHGPAGQVGDACTIQTKEGEIPAEIVGFRDHHTLLMPLGNVHGIRPDSEVRTQGRGLRVPVGEGLLGRVLNGLGEPMDGEGPLDFHKTYPVQNDPPNALERQMIQSPFMTGVRTIDGLLTMGIGQRVGIFAGSGVGKSTLLGMIARNCAADVNVICLVGERGREVREFISHDLGEEGLKRSIVVCATSDEPSLVRIKAAFTATAIAEYFRDLGKNVLLMMDSVTRFAMAQREVGLAVGEPPSSKGYTPSVFSLLPRLMERAGCGPSGAITAIYTVLVDGDDMNEPIADAARGILDGHFVLSRRLTSKGHYPPIDSMLSLSRVMPMVTSEEHILQARRFRELMASYAEVEDLVAIGAYKEGSRPESDDAIERYPELIKFLRQDKSEASIMSQTMEQLEAAIGK